MSRMKEMMRTKRRKQKTSMEIKSCLTFGWMPFFSLNKKANTARDAMIFKCIKMKIEQRAHACKTKSSMHSAAATATKHLTFKYILFTKLITKDGNCVVLHTHTNCGVFSSKSWTKPMYTSQKKITHLPSAMHSIAVWFHLKRRRKKREKAVATHNNNWK